MPYSYNVYTGNGSNTQFTIGFPYIRREHVKVYVAYVDTAYTYVNNTTVQLATAPGAGVRVEVRRITPAANVLVDFADGSTLVAADLDASNLQHLYLEQELDDYSKQTISIDPATGLLTASGQRITNVADPVNAQDAATKAYTDTQDALRLKRDGTQAMTGALPMGGFKVTGAADPTSAQDLATKTYVDTTTVASAGDAMSGNLAMGGNKVTGLGAPTANADAATKVYVDTVALAALPDGDRGDITVSGVGTVWIIDNGAVDEAKVGTGAITETKLGTGAVTEAKIGTGAVTSAKILDGTIVNDDINAAAAISKTKINGTAITAADTGTVTSTMILDGTIVNADVNASAGITAGKLSFTQAGTGATARTVDSKLKDVVSVKDFGAVGDGVADDTAAINAALAASSNLLFPPGAYAVTTITFDGVGRQLTFNSASIVGIATASTPAVIQITGREMLIKGLNVNGNFKTNYTAAIKWHSLSGGTPAQFIRIYDLKISYAKIGILFGQLSGTAVVDAPQSENDVFGYTTRGVEQCVYVNQTNGFITFHGGTIWSGNNEWTTGYTQGNARVINGIQGSVVLIGCELLLTQFQDGRGVDVAGAGVKIESCTIEIANSFFLNTGSLSIHACDGYFAPGGTALFDLTAGNLSVDKYGSVRASSGAVGDNAFLVKTPASGTYSGKILIENSTFEYWNKDKIFTYNSANNFVFGAYVKLKNIRVGAASTGYTEIEDTTRNDLDRFNLDNGVTALTNNWFDFVDYGGGTTLTLSATVPSAEFSNSVQLVATGSAHICTTDAASSLTRTIKQGTSNLYFVSARIYRAAGASSTRIGVRTFSTAGASTGTNLIAANTPNTTWTTVSAIISTAGPLVAFNLQQELGTVSVCDVSMVKLGVLRP